MARFLNDDLAQNLAGTSGNDEFVIAPGTSGAGNDRFDGGAGNDRAFGGTGDDVLIGGDGNDTLAGGDGRDSLAGGAGADVLDGGEGDDSIRPASGADVIDGGAGFDLVDYEFSGVAISVSPTANGLRVVFLGETQTLRNVEFVRGDNQADRMIGSDRAERFSGGTGTDTIEGGGGNDTLDSAGSGSVLRGGAGDDIVNSFAFSGAGAAIFGDAGNDTLTGSGQSDTIFGGDGNDRIDGAAFSTAPDQLFGGAGNDFIVHERSSDTVDGGTGNDTLQFDISSGTLRIDLNLAEQVLAGGSTTLLVRGFENIISAGFTDDTIIGTNAANLIAGGGGSNRVTGGGGNDTLRMAAGGDTLIGGAGNDLIEATGTPGLQDIRPDVLTGGAGRDVFRYTAAIQSTPTATDRITDFTRGVDTIDLSGFQRFAPVTFALVDVDFAYIGKRAFAGGGAAQLRFQNKLLQGDVDGDGTADFVLRVQDVATLGRDDFLL